LSKLIKVGIQLKKIHVKQR